MSNQATILRQFSNNSPVLQFVELFGAGSFHLQTGDMDPNSYVENWINFLDWDDFEVSLRAPTLHF